MADVKCPMCAKPNRPDAEVCEFCGAQYEFDPVDAAQLFTSPLQQPPPTSTVQ